MQQYETALAEAADRQRQLEEEQEILSEKLISLANAAAEWPARQEALEAEVAVGQGQVKALAAQVTEYEERLQRFAKQDQVVAALDTELTDLKHQVSPVRLALRRKALFLLIASCIDRKGSPPER